MWPGNLDSENLYGTDESLHDNHTADRSRWARSSAGHVGLQNMSNTCYLNSLLAQLFMNRPFRSFILDMDVNQADESQRLLYSMKVLFARMQNSYLKAVEPKDFVEAITDYEGEPIDISIQMDVDEFYNLVFDRLEGQMSSMDMKSTFRGYYGGQLVQQVKSTECEHISERNEPFSAIQCDIKGKTNLQESLKAYVGGEVMDGGKPIFPYMMWALLNNLLQRTNTLVPSVAGMLMLLRGVIRLCLMI